MSENEIKKEIKNERVPGYMKKLVIILILVQIVDAYTSVVIEGIGSKIIEDLDITNSLFALCICIASIGMYFVFANQYFCDRFGRKPLLITTTLGMALCCLLLTLTVSVLDFIIYSMLLFFFFSSDIWLIFINEECKSDRKARASYLVLTGGLLGGALMSTILRRVFITETAPATNWRLMMIYPLIVGITATILIIIFVDESILYQQRKEELKHRQINIKDNVKGLFNSPRKTEFYIILVVGFTAGLSRIVLYFTEPYLQSKGIQEDYISTLLTLTALCVLGSYFLTAFAGDLWGRKPLLIIYSIMMPIGVFVLIAGANAGSYGIIVLGAAFVFAAWWGMIGVLRIVTIEILPTERRGTGAGLRSLIVAIGITIGLFLGSFLIYFANQSLEIPFILLVIPCFINVPLVIKFIKETKHVNLAEIRD
ncbi:MAG: MFS transporter [Promethearchaeota archaeon]